MSNSNGIQKIHLAIAILLALEAEAHGRFGHYEDVAGKNWDTPVTRQTIFHDSVWEYKYGAENRIGDPPAGTSCPNVWAGTAGSYAPGESNDLNVCRYDASGKNIDFRPGCCGGFTNMASFEYALTTNGAPNGKRSVCWPHNGGAPSADALETTNYEVQKTYTAGDVIDLSWMSTANHGGAIEYAIVCDGDETYDNFRKNRLKHVKGGNIYRNSSFNEIIRESIISNDEEWSFAPHSMPNAAFHDKVQLPRDLHGDKCTLAWIWWGMVSAGTFIACGDVKILPASGGDPDPEPPTCKEDQILQDGECVDCPEGQKVENGACVDPTEPEPPKCKDDQILDKDGNCVDCPEGQKVENGACVDPTPANPDPSFDLLVQIGKMIEKFINGKEPVEPVEPEPQEPVDEVSDEEEPVDPEPVDPEPVKPVDPEPEPPADGECGENEVHIGEGHCVKCAPGTVAVNNQCVHESQAAGLRGDNLAENLSAIPDCLHMPELC